MSPLTDGSRQVATRLSGIRADHRARYEWAADRLAGQHVVDAGCGVGYGSSILAGNDCTVRAIDVDPEAIAFAEEHYNGDKRITYVEGDLELAEFPQHADAVVAFEVLEHMPHPERALWKWRKMAPKLLVSVPNEDRFPFRPEYTHHMRHYRRDELESLLVTNGWRVVEWWGQEGAESPVEPEVDGRTLVVVAERVDGPVATEPEPENADAERFALPGRGLPNSVAIVAMGGSSRHYLSKAMQAGKRQRFVDEVWAINNAAGVIDHDRVFHMDDLAIQKSRADASPESPIAGVMKWLPEHDRPVYTPREYEWAPASAEYPIEWVLNRTGHCYFNNTVPYALAFALAIGVQEIHLFGCDYNYPDDQAFKREKGRACLEYWIAVASERKVRISIPADSTLMDAIEKQDGEVLYGYDTEWVRVALNGKGFQISRVDRRPEDVPTAKQMEFRYSHDTRLEQLEGSV